MRRSTWLVFAILLTCCHLALSETAREGWLRYSAQHISEKWKANSLPNEIRVLSSGEVVNSAVHELTTAVPELQIVKLAGHASLLLGRAEDMRRAFPEVQGFGSITSDGFWLKTVQRGGSKYWLIVGGNDRGVLYGVFSFLARIAEEKDVSELDYLENPSAPIRWASQWDNLNGSIERGYAGRSIFFDNGNVRGDLTRAREYARLLASIGINACAINNVNADPRILSAEMLPQLVRVADVFRPWGVKLAISVDLSSPIAVGGLKTFDPLDWQVAEWWKKTADAIYTRIPDFAGFVVKADSEGRSGPSQYHRTAADAANVIARALKPHGGVLMYRAFVYNHHLDWHDMKADRARAAYDYFHPLDGQFEDNVVLQIKYGPIDFQAEEPASPLFGAMQHTNEAIELQVTQEYTGQQRHLVFLIPMWKKMLDFDMHVQGVTPVKAIVSGKVWHRPLAGFNAVVNVGLDENWLGHPLAMANLYGYARLAWNPNLTSEQIADDWTQLTFGNDPRVATTTSTMLLHSWRIYVHYTGPLGAQTLTDITGPHYGPGIESSENNGWGQWHRADQQGIGMDRSIATGTGYIGQYSPAVQQLYEPLTNCPDDLVLFMHHVPYTYMLHQDKTVIQYIYDSHYEGALQAAWLVAQWKTLSGLVDEERYNETLRRLEYQAGHAIVWRDAIVNWFHRESGIDDVLGRVGHDRNRVEAEAMQLSGYAPVDVIPWETASGGKAVACFGQSSCAASFNFERASGRYDIAVQYFDLNNGVSRYKLLVNDREVGSWVADDHLPSDKMNGHTSTRYVIAGVELTPGDGVKIEGTPDGSEPAPLDYVEITPDGPTTSGISSAIDGPPASTPH
ncbi:MAG TPA: alpha-glucuronidase family glycosyl hydrolase [Terriglobales bacterium]|nr:alpha-glucuronidase family glycosyl hydrolase [Terriglobales bacterium]